MRNPVHKLTFEEFEAIYKNPILFECQTTGAVLMDGFDIQQEIEDRYKAYCNLYRDN